MTLNASYRHALENLFSPAAFGSRQLRNRLLMAPMTRSQSPGHVPNERNVEYYRRRAAGGVGLIITEGTTVGHPAASGYPDVPAFHGDAALQGWKAVVNAVHAEGAAIIPQLWHVGSIRQPGMQPDGSVPGYAPSAVVHPSLPADTGAAFSGQPAAVLGIERLLERLERGEFDFVALGRALLADPQWPNKLRSGKYAEVAAFSPEHLQRYP